MTRTLFLPSLLCAAFLFAGCQEVPKFGNKLLFTGTENSPTVKFVLDDPTSMGLTITATDRVTKDTKINIEINPNQLESYNKEMKRNYVIPPQGTYDLDSKEATIKAGENISNVVKLNIKSVAGFEEGKTYCIPIEMTGTDSDFPILEASRTMYVVISRVITTRAIDLRGSVAFNVPKFEADARVANLGAATMEARVFVNSFPSKYSNPGISSVMGIEENFLMRFYGEGQGSEKTAFQAGPILVFDNPATHHANKYFPACKTVFAPDKWYHLACVFDGSSAAIYVNGVLDVKIPLKPGTLNLNDTYQEGFWLGQSVGGRRLDGAISEARFWTKALSQEEIQDNECYVDPKTPGLLADWRFNAVQKDGKTVRDETGNGFDAIGTSTNIQWKESVKCP